MLIRTSDAMPSGQFSGVNYSTGCAGRTANWPAQDHWQHTRTSFFLCRADTSLTMSTLMTVSLAEAYVDALPHSKTLTQTAPYDFIGNTTVKGIIDSAMAWWFSNDFTQPACVDQGGVASGACPCGTPGMWNTNWSVVHNPHSLIDPVSQSRFTGLIMYSFLSLRLEQWP